MMQEGVNYRMILQAYGSDNSKARKTCWEAICSNLSIGIDIEEKIERKLSI